MAGKPSNAGMYLYAVVQATEDHEYGEIGIDEKRVHLVTDTHLGAVVSDFGGGKIRPERRHIAAHQAVLKRIMAEDTPLPIAFGMVADSAKGIRRILARNRVAFTDHLQHVHGRVEMGLRVAWDVPNIFEYFVSVHEDLRTARDQIVGVQERHVPSQEDKIEVGRLFEQCVQEDREKQTARVEARLASCCVEIKRNPPRNEMEVMNLACLVERQAVEKEFEAAIYAAAQSFDSNFSFDFNGPWAPHSFVNIELAL